ncbi:hypothetical protein FSP39_021992 [Pinctada imbricata]|uniref:C2H2-type domain-containing protein n=1 Tax=Pinctada imbricata TaxID=66713 RepID=A0AA89C0T7_PINIB|nr:hypothetical protein FSP39_021992 [Pinctada imbricata]
MPPQTKTTPRKERKCPMCPFKTIDMENMKEHLAICGLKQMEKRFLCSKPDCNYATNKSSNLSRHLKRHSDSDATVPQSDGEWRRSDPGNLSDVIGDVSADVSGDESDTEDRGNDADIRVIEATVPADPTMRKRTAPTPVYYPKRMTSGTQSDLENDVGEPVITRPAIERPTLELPPRHAMHPPLIPLGDNSRLYRPPVALTLTTSSGTQTEPIQKRKVTWVITKWQEGDKNVEKIEMVEEIM